MGKTKLSEQKAAIPMPLCEAGGSEWQCDHPRRRRGNPLCGGHDGQRRRGVDPLKPLQKQAWGGRPSQKHLPCEFPGCVNNRRWAGLCSGHYEHRKKGQELRPLREKNRPHPWLPGWNRPWVASSGYAFVVRTDDASVRQLEHRAVMEHVLGRPLHQHENVHHLNGVRNDNRPENLELWSTMQPSGQSVADKLKFAREIIALYG